MADEKLLTVREVASFLGVSEKEVMDLADSGALPAYKVGGVYLRFKKEQVYDYRKLAKPPLSAQGAIHESVQAKAGLNDKVSDFFYFNDFYILSFLLVILLLVIIFRGY